MALITPRDIRRPVFVFRAEAPDVGIHLCNRGRARAPAFVGRVDDARLEPIESRRPVLDAVSLTPLEGRVGCVGVRLTVGAQRNVAVGHRADAEAGGADNGARVGDTGEVQRIHRTGNRLVGGIPLSVEHPAELAGKSHAGVPGRKPAADGAPARGVRAEGSLVIDANRGLYLEYRAETCTDVAGTPETDVRGVRGDSTAGGRIRAGGCSAQLARGKRTGRRGAGGLDTFEIDVDRAVNLDVGALCEGG